MPIMEQQGVKMHYQTSGRGEPAIAFVHGIGSTWRVWQHQMEMNSKKHLIVAPDVPGHGESDAGPGGFENFMLAGDMINCLMSDTFDLNYVAVGHSAAGITLLRLMSIDRTRLKGVVFVDCPRDIPSEAFWQLHGLHESASATSIPRLIIDASIGTPDSRFESLAGLLGVTGDDHIIMRGADHRFFSSHPEALYDPLQRIIAAGAI